MSTNFIIKESIKGFKYLQIEELIITQTKCRGLMKSYQAACSKVSRIRQLVNGYFPGTCDLRNNLH